MIDACMKCVLNFKPHPAQMLKYIYIPRANLPLHHARSKNTEKIKEQATSKANSRHARRTQQSLGASVPRLTVPNSTAPHSISHRTAHTETQTDEVHDTGKRSEFYFIKPNYVTKSRHNHLNKSFQTNVNQRPTIVYQVRTNTRKTADAATPHSTAPHRTKTHLLGVAANTVAHRELFRLQVVAVLGELGV